MIDAGRLVAFDVADIDAGKYAFYMFIVSSDEVDIPGASDLLLNKPAKRVRAAGMCYMNLGLGINEGIEFFKRKWGGAFLNCEHGLYDIGGGPIIERVYARWRPRGLAGKPQAFLSASMIFFKCRSVVRMISSDATSS